MFIELFAVGGQFIAFGVGAGVALGAVGAVVISQKSKRPENISHSYSPTPIYLDETAEEAVGESYSPNISTAFQKPEEIVSIAIDNNCLGWKHKEGPAGRSQAIYGISKTDTVELGFIDHKDIKKLESLLHKNGVEKLDAPVAAN